MCLYVCQYTCICMCASLCVHMHTKSRCLVSSQLLSTSFFKAGSLGPGAHQFSQTGRPMSSSDPAVFDPHRELGLEMLLLYPAFTWVVGNLNSGPHAWAAGALPTKPSPSSNTEDCYDLERYFLYQKVLLFIISASENTNLVSSNSVPFWHYLKWSPASHLCPQHTLNAKCKL